MRPLGAAAFTSAIDVVAADEIERDVRAAVGRLDDRPRERVDVERAVGGARRLDARVEPERAAAFELVGGARGADDARAERVRELERGGADAGADRVHEHPLARLRRAPG